jgi:hypothetical protein
MRARMREAAARAKALPHREEYLKIGLEFVEGVISLYEELVERVERDFAETPPAGPS